MLMNGERWLDSKQLAIEDHALEGDAQETPAAGGITTILTSVLKRALASLIKPVHFWEDSVGCSALLSQMSEVWASASTWGRYCSCKSLELLGSTSARSVRLTACTGCIYHPVRLAAPITKIAKFLRMLISLSLCLSVCRNLISKCASVLFDQKINYYRANLTAY